MGPEAYTGFAWAGIIGVALLWVAVILMGFVFLLYVFVWVYSDEDEQDERGK